jgi:glycosyltransferase involved in cell wall biosynthesis
MSKNILIYDSDAGGHHYEFVKHILDYECLERNTNYYFLINSKTASYLSKTIASVQSKRKNIFVYEIPFEIDNYFREAKFEFIKALRESSFLRNYVTELEVTSLIFLQIDTFQFVLGWWKIRGYHKYLEIKGIFFEPHIQQPIESVGIIFKRVRKRIQLHWMLLNKNVKKIFILNDHRSVGLLNSKLCICNRFFYLPDPVYTRIFEKKDTFNNYNIDRSKKILLCVGGIQRRKNILTIINSLQLLNKESKHNIVLLILGYCKDKSLLKDIEIARNKFTDIPIILENKFIDENEFESAIMDSTIVFTLYSNFYSSSGILGHAAKHKKYIITTENGVLGRLTREYNLGKTLNPHDLSAISNAISEGIVREEAGYSNVEFLERHTTQEFCEVILS